MIIKDVTIKPTGKYMKVWSYNNGITEISLGSLIDQDDQNLYIVTKTIMDDEKVVTDRLYKFQSYIDATTFATELASNSNLVN